MNARNVSQGFTLIELMIVIAVLTVLATLAVPSYQERVIRAQVTEGLQVTQFVQQAVAGYYERHGRMPADNAAAGVPPADSIVGNYVSSVAVRDGAVVVTFGQRSNRNLGGKVLAIRPAVVAEYRAVPIAWVCGQGGVPAKMTVHGENATTLPPTFLPVDCRPGPAGQ